MDGERGMHGFEKACMGQQRARMVAEESSGLSTRHAQGRPLPISGCNRVGGVDPFQKCHNEYTYISFIPYL